MRHRIHGQSDFAVPAFWRCMAPAITSPRSIASPPGRPAAAKRYDGARFTSRRMSWVCRCAPRPPPKRCRGSGRVRRARSRCGSGRRLRADFAAGDAGAPRRGCLNIHAQPAAALARRGTDPGCHPGRRPETGITIMQMDAGLDTGPMLLRQVCRSRRQTTTANLARHARLDRCQSDPGHADRPIRSPQPQTEAGATYAPKLSAGEWPHRLEPIRRYRSIARCARSTHGPGRSLSCREPAEDPGR